MSRENAFNCYHTNKIWLELAYSAVTWHDMFSIVWLSGMEIEDIRLEDFPSDNILPAFWQKVDRPFWQKVCFFWSLWCICENESSRTCACWSVCVSLVRLCVLAFASSSERSKHRNICSGQHTRFVCIWVLQIDVCCLYLFSPTSDPRIPSRILNTSRQVFT